MNIRSKLRADKGFTLIEIMVSMLIISIGLLLLLPLTVISMQSNNFADEFTNASMLIKDKMEELKNIATVGTGADTVGTASRSWAVTNAEANLLRMVVNVDWSDMDGRVHSNSMVSYLMTD